MRASVHDKMAGFTLMEAIMVIVILAVLGALVVSFVNPLKGYFDATRRADLADAADTTLRRMARELHAALPNSVRVSANYLEFLPTVTGGRYRAEQDCSGSCSGDILDFTAPDGSFDVLGTLSVVPTAGQEVVVYNLGIPGANAYASDNSSPIVSATVSSIQITAKQFPLESPTRRFQVVTGPVTFACVGSTLWRYSGYAKQPSQPTNIAAAPLSAATSKAKLATGVDCANTGFAYAAGVTQRGGLVSMRLKMSNGSESVTLLHQVHVANVP
ncbi:MAG: type II secretion system GspH family protein [Methylophilaceae bacterium]|nr:type II secretion system GspH family protein [Methylophilaceae bacterium]